MRSRGRLLRYPERVSAPPVHWPSFLREIDSAERTWNNRVVRYPREDCVPWLPFPRSQFIALLTDAVEAAPVRWDQAGAGGLMFKPSRFMDVGCGAGTKIRLAQALFGLQGFGIDIVPALVAEARSHGVYAEVADAFDWQDYKAADIVYMNRPSTQMAELEAVVMDRMASGAVLMLVNGRGDPAKEGWTLVSQEWGTPVQGCWIKP